MKHPEQNVDSFLTKLICMSEVEMKVVLAFIEGMRIGTIKSKETENGKVTV